MKLSVGGANQRSIRDPGAPPNALLAEVCNVHLSLTSAEGHSARLELVAGPGAVVFKWGRLGLALARRGVEGGAVAVNRPRRLARTSVGASPGPEGRRARAFGPGESPSFLALFSVEWIIGVRVSYPLGKILGALDRVLRPR